MQFETGTERLWVADDAAKAVRGAVLEVILVQQVPGEGEHRPATGVIAEPRIHHRAAGHTCLVLRGSASVKTALR